MDCGWFGEVGGGEAKCGFACVGRSRKKKRHGGGEGRTIHCGDIKETYRNFWDGARG